MDIAFALDNLLSFVNGFGASLNFDIASILGSLGSSGVA